MNTIRSKIRIKRRSKDNPVHLNLDLSLNPLPNLNLNLLFVLAIAFSILVPQAAAQPVKVPDARRVYCYWKFTITCDPGTRSVGLNVLLPQTLEGRQKVLALKQSHRPTKVFKSGLNECARFVFDRPTDMMELIIDLEIDLYRFDWTTVMRRGPREMKEDVEPWLAAEALIEKDDPDIQAAARSVVGRNTEETLRRTMDFVVRHMTPTEWEKADHGAAWALKTRRGDCTEYADLFVALCRANNIPARWVEGIMAYTKVPKGATVKHDWAEVYLATHGWVAFDPFHVDLKAASFSNKQPDYIYLDFQRRNAALGNLHFWSYDYSGGKAAVGSEFVVTQIRTLRGPVD